MCSYAAWIAAIGFVASSVTSGVQYSNQQQQAKANFNNAVKANQDTIEALNRRNDQVNESAAQDVMRNELAAIEMRGRAKTAGVGLAQVSLNEVLQGVNAQAARAKSNILSNRDNALAQNRLEMKSAAALTASRANAVPRPSMAAYGFEIAGNAADSLTTYDALVNRGR